MGDGHDRTSGSLAESSDMGPAGLDAGAEGDLLSDVLETIRLRGAVFFLWEPSWPFATSVPSGSRIAPTIVPGADQMISYHVVVEGPCWGAVLGERPVRLESGDILLLPRGDAYVMSSEPQQPSSGEEGRARAFFRTMATGQLPPVVKDGGGGPEANRIVCGFLCCDMRPFNPLLGTLPRMLRLSVGPDGDDPLRAFTELAIAESRQSRGGRRCMLLRLSELMFVEVIRRYLQTRPAADGGWLQGLRDPVVGKALALMHRRVDNPWTLDALAREIGTSRSTLAERFTSLAGEPPMQYLARWRMQVAARALAEGHQKVYAVARSVGYDSEAAFSRAFKRIVGVTPTEWRARRTGAQGVSGDSSVNP